MTRREDLEGGVACGWGPRTAAVCGGGRRRRWHDCRLLFSFDFLLILFLSLKADSETQEKIATLHEFSRIKAKPISEMNPITQIESSLPNPHQQY